MIILKLICLFLIFFISMKIGFVIANRYKLRLNNLENIKTSLKLFKTKIEYTNDRIIEVFNQISKIIYEPLVTLDANLKLQYCLASEVAKTDNSYELYDLLSKLEKSYKNNELSEEDYTAMHLSLEFRMPKHLMTVRRKMFLDYHRKTYFKG